MKRNSATYKKAVHWIAYNDEPTELDRDVVALSISVALIADVFGVHEVDVANDVIDVRSNLK